MTITAHEQRLLRLSKLEKRDLALLSEGVSLASALNRSLTDAAAVAVADRIALAQDFIRAADEMLRSKHDMSRAAVGRYYYAMYHSMRAVSFAYNEGDDFEGHATLHRKGVPKDYPNGATAANSLRDARLRRNEADYDPYPQDGAYFRSAAKALAPVARSFVEDARQYLKGKGNPYL